MTVKSQEHRERRASSNAVRERILKAAAVEFASHGFAGASTRSIAERSGVHQAQLGYHIGAKEELWCATVNFLFARLRSYLDEALPSNHDEPISDPVEIFADVIRRHVRHTARHPELSRIMLIEASQKSERVTWLLKNHVRPTLAALQLVWADVQAAGKGRNHTAEEVFMMMIALAPTPFAQVGIMRPLLGAERCTPERHAESIIDWILV